MHAGIGNEKITSDGFPSSCTADPISSQRLPLRLPHPPPPIDDLVFIESFDHIIITIVSPV